MGAVQEVPAGVVDGVNRVYTLSQKPYNAATLLVWVNGLMQAQGINYTIGTKTITMSVPSTLQIGDTIWVKYWTC